MTAGALASRVTSMRRIRPWARVMSWMMAPTSTASSTSEVIRAGVGDRDVHAPALVKEPFVAGVVDAADDARHAELLLGEPADHQVVLVVAGGGDHDVGAAQVGRGEVGVLTRVGRHDVDAGQHGLETFGRGRDLFDQGDFVVAVDEVQRDRDADGATPGDHDLHEPLDASRTCS